MTMANQFIVTKIISLTLTYYNLTTNWPENQKGSSRGSQCTQFSSYQTKGSKVTFDEGQKFDLDFSIPNMKITTSNIYSLKATIVPNVITTFTCIKKRGHNILSGQLTHGITTSLTLTFDHLVWKSIEIIHSPKIITVVNLVRYLWYQAKESKVINIAQISDWPKGAKQYSSISREA